MTANELVDPEDSDGSWLVGRRPAILMELPVAMRWEVTRRHPYYLRFWEAARRHHQQPSTDPTQRRFEEAAALILRTIGVNGEPPPPGATAASLGCDQLSSGWESGAVAPVTVRGLFGLLLAALPPDLCNRLGEILLAHAAATVEQGERMFSSLQMVDNLKHPTLECFPCTPVVGINVHAPQRVILKAMEEQIQQWKQERGLAERRRRDDKLEDYLTVWDLREGWVGDHYDLSREQTLRQIAQDQGLPLSTVANRYRSAFRLIVGADFTPGRWERVVAVWKIAFSATLISKAARVLRRPRRSPARQAIPSSRLVDAPKEWLEQNRIVPDEIALTELLLDLRSLIAAGRSDGEILQELELSQDTVPILDYLRQRQDDPL